MNEIKTTLEPFFWGYILGAPISFLLFYFVRARRPNHPPWKTVHAKLKKHWWAFTVMYDKDRFNQSALLALLMSWMGVVYLLVQLAVPCRANSYLRDLEVRVLYQLHRALSVLLFIFLLLAIAHVL